uniref:Uncharacterized protein n=1 Tax=Lactuca sativa TaxID=4236 RepID=A0A9R1UZQ6_LACSA|nr:hypothetical protein LSAT_V11C700382840 [Lactuca sativa]
MIIMIECWNTLVRNGNWEDCNCNDNEVRKWSLDLQMLHNLMRHYRWELIKIPTLRKLLKVTTRKFEKGKILQWNISVTPRIRKTRKGKKSPKSKESTRRVQGGTRRVGA